MLFANWSNRSKMKSKIINEKVSAFDFYLDITKSNLLSFLCEECNLSELFIEIYNVKKNKIDISQKLLQIGFNIVSIPYKSGDQDVAIKMTINKLPVLLSTLSEYDFNEITVWSANERWEQHLFLKSASRNIFVENENDLYLCYNHAEKMVELYLDPKYDVEKVEKLIKNA